MFERDRRPSMLSMLGIAAIGATMAVVSLVVRDVIVRSETTAPGKAATATSSAPSAHGSGLSTPASAAAATLRVDDLPPGFRAVQAGPARFSGSSGAAPDNWDVVFQSGDPFSRDFRAAESIVVIYSTSAAAIAALRIEQATEPGRGGHQVAALGVGQDSQVWEEPLSESPDYRLVRVLFHVGRAMSQVTMAAPVGSAHVRETVRLASIQAERLAGL